MPDPAAFIARWSASGAAERANYALFLAELCDLLEVPRPDPTRPDDADNAYVFERGVTFQHADGTASTGRIDLYKRACFILEAKQGVEKREAEAALSESVKAKAKSAKKGHGQRGSAAWDEMMLKAFGQAESYARALPASEGRPPLLIIVDVGHSIELYAEFSRTGGTYIPFPDPRSHRIRLEQLADPAVRAMLRLAWVEPLALDPARRSARVTCDIAEKLGRLAALLEKSGHAAEAVATFLMRALFTMFAEDVELLPKNSFRQLLESRRGRLDTFVPKVQELWAQMNTGGFSNALDHVVLKFNGGLFADASALPLTEDQLALLCEAAAADWREVEPAIFGTLLERALDPHERHKLGAHYTPRAYVERLVLPAIIEPLRAEWDAVKAAALTLDRGGKTKDAIAEGQRFHRRLCELRVLDPACGSGNFLYVTLEHLKRLEGEVLNLLDSLGHEQAQLEMAGFSVDPHQLLGIEVNPRAAAIAELVLWIGYLQWHFRTRGRVTPPEPIIKNFRNIECRDAVLACAAATPVLDAGGSPITRWDGRTTKPHPVTGEEVPDETARVPLLHYANPRPAEWPQADYIIGNPPFIGTARMRDALGDGYTQTLRACYPDVPESADFVMYWWHQAAVALRQGKTAQFGFITTNSLRQTFNRRVLEHHLAGKPVSLCQIGPNIAPGGPLPSPLAASTLTPRDATPDPSAQLPSPLAASTLTPGAAHPDSSPQVPSPLAASTLTPGDAYPDPSAQVPSPLGASTLTPGATTPDPSAPHPAPPLLVSSSPSLPISQPPSLRFSPSSLPPLSLRFAIPDHPWVDSADGAAVRIAMTLAAPGSQEGTLSRVTSETSRADEVDVTLSSQTGLIHADLTIGANVAGAVALQANENLSNHGVITGGEGFIVTRAQAEAFGLGKDPGLELILKPILNGKDITARSRDAYVIDLYGMTAEQVRERYPQVYQWVLTYVKPVRDQNNRESRRLNWWLFNENVPKLRNMLRGLRRYISTVETAKHRVFFFLDEKVLPAHKLVNIALEDAFYLGVLSSRIHVVWALATGSRLGVGNDPVYVKTASFEKFPFPEATEAQRARIRELGEAIDAHRKRQQAQHPDLTLTDMYNVLEKLRGLQSTVVPPSGGSESPPSPPEGGTTMPLSAKERLTHERGLLSVLLQLHDELDAAVAAAYALPADADDATILTHLCQLNAQRAAEEQRGQVRWLRPEFQARNAEPGMRNEPQSALDMPEEASGLPPAAPPPAKSKQPWPKPLPERVRLIATTLTSSPQSAADLATRFKAAKPADVEEILDTLVLMGRAREEAEGYAVK